MAAYDNTATLPPQAGNGPHDNGVADYEKQRLSAPPAAPPKSLGAGTALAIATFAVTITAHSCVLMEWRGVTIDSAFIGNFFFAAALGLIITAQWEMAVGNGIFYTIFSVIGLFYASYAAILTPAFGIVTAYGDDTVQLSNALGFFLIMWSIIIFCFLIAALPTNLTYIGIFFFVAMGLLTIAASYFSAADGHAVASAGLKKAGGAFFFVASLYLWYLTIYLLIKDSLVALPLGDTSRFFAKKKVD